MIIYRPAPVLAKKSAYFLNQETAEEMDLLAKAPAAVWFPGNSWTQVTQGVCPDYPGTGFMSESMY